MKTEINRTLICHDYHDKIMILFFKIMIYNDL